VAGKRDAADDLAQETAARAWEFRRSFTPGTNMKAWLGTILRNQYYSSRRREWRQVPWTAELDRITFAPPEKQRWTVELSDTACAMNALPDQIRDTVILVCLCGFSYQETAQLTMVAVGTVKSRVCRGREFLAATLESARSQTQGLKPATGNSLVEWFDQIHRLEISARRTLASGNFAGFHVFRTTPKMAVRRPIGLLPSSDIAVGGQTAA
jgi:RNA polymerase sigma-70 factor (ECF subfamily)